MLNQNQDIFTRALNWLKEGHQVLLYTVVNTWGSSPRPPGSIMVLRDDGHVAGSVSGGCIEDDLIHRIKKSGFSNKPEIVHYGVDLEDARRLGLPCGGNLRIVQEQLDIESLEQLLSRLNKGQIVSRNLDLHKGIVTIGLAQDADMLSCDEHTFISIFGPRYRLLIIGAGQISELLSQIALSLDFAVTVCDPREEYHAEWSIEDVNLVSSMPDDTVVEMKVDQRTAVVALTHDPKLDDLALIDALNSPAFYIGALGSKANQEKRKERLLQFDLTQSQVSKLRGPVGLDIASKTPAEIAVSIAAELIAAKNSVSI